MEILFCRYVMHHQRYIPVSVYQVPAWLADIVPSSCETRKWPGVAPHTLVVSDQCFSGGTRVGSDRPEPVSVNHHNGIVVNE